MKRAFFAALALSAIAAPALSRPVDPGYGVQQPRPINVLRRNGINPIARVVLLPLLPFIKLQAELSPEKASCWNDRAEEVAGCSVVKQVETAKERREERRENRPTPYGF